MEYVHRLGVVAAAVVVDGDVAAAGGAVADGVPDDVHVGVVLDD